MTEFLEIVAGLFLASISTFADNTRIILSGLFILSPFGRHNILLSSENVFNPSIVTGVISPVNTTKAFCYELFIFLKIFVKSPSFHSESMSFYYFIYKKK
jgi:hypothetical protein